MLFLYSRISCQVIWLLTRLVRFLQMESAGELLTLFSWLFTVLKALQELYDSYCRHAPASSTMDNVKWMKLNVDLGLIDNKLVTKTEVDMIFTKVRVELANEPEIISIWGL